jgi:hypothetical protein
MYIIIISKVLRGSVYYFIYVIFLFLDYLNIPIYCLSQIFKNNNFKKVH